MPASKRLQTDWIDLYQLHWPERSTNFFGQLSYKHKDEDDLAGNPRNSTHRVKAGRSCISALSNETPWAP